MTTGWRKDSYERAARKWIEEWQAIGGSFKLDTEAIDGDDVGFDVRCMTRDGLEKAADLVMTSLTFPRIHEAVRHIVRTEKLMRPA